MRQSVPPFKLVFEFFIYLIIATETPRSAFVRADFYFTNRKQTDQFNTGFDQREFMGSTLRRWGIYLTIIPRSGGD